MKKYLLALGFVLVATPTWAACAVTNLQVKDNAAVTAAVPYADDGSGGSNCSPQIQIKQGGNVANVDAGHSLQTAGEGTAGSPAGGVVSVQGVASGTAVPVSGTVTANAGTNLNTSALATSANQATNGATTSHTCSTGGYSELGCLGQIDDDVKAVGTIQGNVNVTLTDCSGSISAGGSAQNAFTAQTTLHGFTIANIDSTSGSGEPLWISFTTTAAASTAASYPLAAPTATTFANLSSFTAPIGLGTGHALSVIAATTGHKFSCTWW